MLSFSAEMTVPSVATLLAEWDAGGPDASWPAEGYGSARARSHGRVVPPLIHFTPDSLTYLVPLFLKRRCGRTPGSDRGAAIVLAPAGHADSALKQRGVVVGLGRIVALGHHSFTSYQGFTTCKIIGACC
jgi:hypothetical protein